MNKSRLIVLCSLFFTLSGVYWINTEYRNNTSIVNEQIETVKTASKTNSSTNNKKSNAPLNKITKNNPTNNDQPDNFDQAKVINLRHKDIVRSLNKAKGDENDRLKLALALSDDYSFNLTQEKKDKNGNEHARLKQHYRDIPVWGESISVHRDVGDKYYSANGNVALGLDSIDQKIDILDQTDKGSIAALRFAMKENSHRTKEWQFKNQKSELVLYPQPGTDGVVEDYVLAYAVSYFASPKSTVSDTISVTNGLANANTLTPTRPHMLIDAFSFDVLKKWDGLAFAEAQGPGGNEKTGMYVYGTDFPALDVTENGTQCSLNNANVRTIDMQQRTSEVVDPFTFPCPENTFKQINGAWSPANDAHFFGGVVFDMFNEWLNTPPLTFQLSMRVHYSTQYNNAFWDGSSMTFGDGGYNVFYPLVDINVSAHEVAHGFTEQNSNLIYSSESGGMNEAFSDITGEAAEYYLRGTVDWLQAADISISEPALRYFEDPTLDGSSIGHADDYEEGMDVHYSSGVFNRAFFLLANTQGWGVREAFEVFAHANQNYWTESETFTGGMCGVVDSANDLGRDAEDVVNAFQLVGVTCADVDIIDTDLDGMPDSWELRFGFNIQDAADALLDADNDGLNNLEEYQHRTQPMNSDSDGDSLSDAQEVNVHLTNPNLVDSDRDDIADNQEILLLQTDPLNADTDGDGLGDGWELEYGFNPLSEDNLEADTDSDNDGLTNLQEFEYQSNPLLVDSDDDGLQDGEEVNQHFTQPNDADTDNDGLTDGDEELLHGTNPNRRDSDSDYLSDGRELALGLDPQNSDEDNDNLPDGEEVSIYMTDPFNPDTDGDTLPDGWEAEYAGPNPLVADADNDSDGDGLSNLQEYNANTHPDEIDSDFDGLNDFEELELGTNPNLSDSDSDTMTDGWEVQFGLNPLNIEDAYLDSDGDGWLNHQEFKFSTHPLSGVSSADIEAVPRVPTEPFALVADAFGDCSITRCRNMFSFIQGNVLGIYSSYGWTRRFETTQFLSFYTGPWSINSAQFSSYYLWYSSADSTERIAFFDMNDFPLNDVSDEIAAAVFEDSVNGNIYGEALLNAQDESYSVELNQQFIDDTNLRKRAIFSKAFVDLRREPGEQETVLGGVTVENNATPTLLTVTYDADNDSDGIVDLWEEMNGLDSSNPVDALQDRDNDGVVNLQEYIQGTNLDAADSDLDGMGDAFEIRYNLNPLLDDSDQDRDGDGLSNLDEFVFGLSPLNRFDDTDADGMADIWEISVGLDPHNANDALEDIDGDGALNIAEYLNTLDPNNADTDGDGIADGFELEFGLNPLVNDAAEDMDQDGLSNLEEFQRELNPTSADSDNDGIADGDEVNVLGENLVLNGEFDNGLTQWEVFTRGGETNSGDVRGVLSFDPEDTDNPLLAMEFDSVLSGAADWGIRTLQRNISVEPGRHYQFTFRVRAVNRSASGTTPAVLRPVLFDGAMQIQVEGGKVTLENNQWKQLHYQFVANSTAEAVPYFMFAHEENTGHTIYLDSISIVEISEPASTVSNLVTNFHFNQGLSGWDTFAVGGEAQTSVHIGATSEAGRTDNTVLALDIHRVENTSAMWSIRARQNQISVIPGASYRFSAKLRTELGLGKMYVAVYDQGSTTTQIQNSGEVVLHDTWQDLVFDFVAGESGFVQAYFMFAFAENEDRILYLDDVLIVPLEPQQLNPFNQVINGDFSLGLMSWETVTLGEVNPGDVRALVYPDPDESSNDVLAMEIDSMQSEVSPWYIRARQFDVPVVANTTYRFSARVRTASGQGIIRAAVYDPNILPMSPQIDTGQFIVTNQWQRIEMDFIAGVSGLAMPYFMYAYTQNIGQTIYLDDVSIVPVGDIFNFDLETPEQLSEWRLERVFGSITEDDVSVDHISQEDNSAVFFNVDWLNGELNHFDWRHDFLSSPTDIRHSQFSFDIYVPEVYVTTEAGYFALFVYIRDENSAEAGISLSGFGLEPNSWNHIEMDIDDEEIIGGFKSAGFDPAKVLSVSIGFQVDAMSSDNRNEAVGIDNLRLSR